MIDADFVKESKTFLCTWLRSWEAQNAGSDAEKLKEIGELSDDEILRKWLWTATIASAPVCFIGLPILLSLLAIVFSGLIMQVLWFLTKLSMAIVLILLSLAAYITWHIKAE